MEYDDGKAKDPEISIKDIWAIPVLR